MVDRDLPKVVEVKPLQGRANNLRFQGVREFLSIISVGFVPLVSRWPDFFFEWVIIAGDRVPVGDSERVCEVSFFGRQARFPIGPYVLATLLQCPVYLLHCFRLDDNYRLVMQQFEEEIRPSRDKRHEAYANYAQKFADALESQVIRAPLQWFNFYDFWEIPVDHSSAPLASSPK